MNSGTKLFGLAVLCAAAACSGSEGKQGPPGPQGDPGPAATVVFGSTAGTAAEGNDARLSDARAPLAGSAFYLWNGTIPQTASMSLTGAGTFGGAVTAASFSGDGSGLTSLDAGHLAAGTIPDARLSAHVPLLDGAGRLGASVLPAAVPLLDGTGRLSASVVPVAVLPRTVTAPAIGQNGFLSVSGLSAPPAVTIWSRTGPGKWTDATGNATFLVEYDPAVGTVTVTNTGTLLVDLFVVATGP